MYQKMVLTQLTVDRLKQLALAQGRTEEWFDKWQEDFVTILEPYF